MIVTFFGDAASRILVILQDTGLHPITDGKVFLWTRKATPFSLFFSSPVYHTLCPSSMYISPTPGHLTSPMPKMFYLYLSISWHSSLSLPMMDRLLTFQVPVVNSCFTILILFLSRSPVSFFALMCVAIPPWWFPAVHADVGNLGPVRSGRQISLVALIWRFVGMLIVTQWYLFPLWDAKLVLGLLALCQDFYIRVFLLLGGLPSKARLSPTHPGF